MKTYEWVSSIIGILSLIISILYLMVTYYFSKQVSKLAKKANEIAEKTYILQQGQFAKEIQKDEWKLSSKSSKFYEKEKLTQSWENLWQIIIDELKGK